MTGGSAVAVTPTPTAQTARPDFISSAAATFGSPETPALSIGTQSGESTFASPPPAPRSAEELFSSPPSGGVPALAAASATGTPSGETAAEADKSNDVNDSNEFGDGEMMDVPLSPDPVPAVASSQNGVAGALPNLPATEVVTTQDANGTAATAPAPAAAASDLFAAIGMPPPPVRKR